MKTILPPQPAMRTLLACLLFAAPLVATTPAAGQPATHSDRVKIKQRIEWHLSELLRGYDKSSRKDPKWNGAVSNTFLAFALLRGSDSGNDLNLEYLVAKSCRKALSAGSDDPMMAYLAARDDDMNASVFLEDVKPAMREAADKLLASSYPPIYKLNAAARAGGRARTVFGTMFPPEMQRYRQKAVECLREAMADPATPPLELVDACQLLLEGARGREALIEADYKVIEQALLKHSTNTWVHHLVKGIYHEKIAWSRHRSGYANTVPDRAWEPFRPNLQQAATEIETAWKLNPRQPSIASRMIMISMCLERDDVEIDRWFQRAMQADPGNYNACLNRLNSLEPKWGGSTGKMLGFARHCATNWGGDAPLILEKAHDTLYKLASGRERTNYWRQPGLWEEISAAYDKYQQTQLREITLARVPDTATRSRLARVAYRTRHYQEFIDLLRDMNDVDLRPFGGSEPYLQCARHANTRVERRLDEIPLGKEPRVLTQPRLFQPPAK